MYENYKEPFNELIQSLRMTRLSLDVWADNDYKRMEVEGKMRTLDSVIELSTMLYNSVNEKQGA